MHILVGGGTGFIGQALVAKLINEQYTVSVLCRDIAKAKALFSEAVDLIENLDAVSSVVDVVINLAGEAIADKRWSETRKEQLKNSRIGETNKIVEWIGGLEKKPKALISGSAIGFYGNHPEDNELGEDAESRACFSHELCSEWELAATKAEAFNVRVCLVRTGVVLAKHGGALKKMVMPYRLGLGGPMGSGRQWTSWIHLDDMINLLCYLIHNEQIQGPVNATAPYPEINRVFSKKLAKSLSLPSLIPMPELMVKILFGEAAELLIEGQRVVPKKILKENFVFKYPKLEIALSEIFKA